MRVSFLIILLIPAGAFGQSVLVPLNEDYHHWIDRYEVKAGKIYPQIFSAIKPYNRAAIVAFVDSLSQDGYYTSASDQFNQEYLLNDSWEWSGVESSNAEKPVLRHFYRKKTDFFHVQEPDFNLHVNPVLYVGYGQDSELDEALFINTRGVEVRGMIDKKVGFYSYLSDNQAQLPSYVTDYVAENGVVPHEGFWKVFKDNKGVDFLHARGSIFFNATRHINIQFGYDRFSIGNGYRSLILSDNAPPSLFLKGNVQVWKLNYLFMTNRVTANPGGLYPNKYVATHHLSVNIGKKLNIGVFETVVYKATDSSQFDPSYLNPIIFYRAVEHQNGSSDNVLLGADFKWNIARSVQLYGQLVFDEFLLDNLKAGNGWWANKFGIQGGLKYIDVFGVSNLDVQGEINMVKPYTYSHHTQYGNYSSFHQPLAHPLGANFKEVVGIVRYQPLPKLNLKGKLIFAQIG
ncbi:MAG: hypothetical protein L0Y35_09530, partial [Flammeovirgaceae bacterium]|nr:hypothetical protein [Flammeovirgaceae bacterium]